MLQKKQTTCCSLNMLCSLSLLCLSHSVSFSSSFSYSVPCSLNSLLLFFSWLSSYLGCLSELSSYYPPFHLLPEVSHMPTLRVSLIRFAVLSYNSALQLLLQRCISSKILISCWTEETSLLDFSFLKPSTMPGT